MTYLENFEIAYEQSEENTSEYLDEDFMMEFLKEWAIKLKSKGNTCL